MIKKLLVPTLAVALAVGAITTGSQTADARGRGAPIAAGVAAGIIGLGVLGAYAHARDRPYYHNSCYTVGGGCFWREGNCFQNRYGEMVCRRGYQVCEPRRTVCD